MRRRNKPDWHRRQANQAAPRQRDVGDHKDPCGPWHAGKDRSVLKAWRECRFFPRAHTHTLRRARQRDPDCEYQVSDAQRRPEGPAAHHTAQVIVNGRECMELDLIGARCKQPLQNRARAFCFSAVSTRPRRTLKRLPRAFIPRSQRYLEPSGCS